MTLREHISRYLQPGHYIDSQSPEVITFADAATFGAISNREKAIALFEAVRDRIWYDPYSVMLDPDDYRASVISRQAAAFCVPKAILLAASARAVGIPAAVGFADVKNHLSSTKLRDLMQSEVFTYHGYAELYVNDRWLKVTPTFNRELCARFGVRPLVFDGATDALFHEYDLQNRQRMEYVRDRGSFAEPPVDDILRDFHKNYPRLMQYVSSRTVGGMIEDKAFSSKQL